MEIMKLTIKEDFRRGTVFSCFSYHKITLFENKYGIKLITLISMHRLNLIASIVQIASCIDTFQIFFITTFHRQIV